MGLDSDTTVTENIMQYHWCFNAFQLSCVNLEQEQTKNQHRPPHIEELFAKNVPRFFTSEPDQMCSHFRIIENLYASSFLHLVQTSPPFG